MTTANAIKKLEKLGHTVQQFSERNFGIICGDRQLSFRQNGPDQTASIICIGIKSIHDHSDPITDYCAFTFYSNLSQAIKYNF